MPGWAPGTTLTQGLADGTDILAIADDEQDGAYTLLEVGGEPYLVVTRPSSGRVLGISGYGDDSGAATPFRNEAPRGFFDNQLLPRLVDAVVLVALSGRALGRPAALARPHDRGGPARW